MAKTVLRLTNASASVKIADAVETIDLDVDLKLTREVISGTPSVSIVAIIASGAFSIARNGVTIFATTGVSPSTTDFSQFEMKDTIQATQDIAVTVAAGSQVYLLLRKDAGFKTTFEPEQFGSYDNPDAAGS